MARARDLARSALTWAGLTGVVLVGVPPMVLGYPERDTLDLAERVRTRMRAALAEMEEP